MKYPIISLLFLAMMLSCNQETRQEEKAERASYNDFFTKRSEEAKKIKDHNYSVRPESGVEEEQDQFEDKEVLEGIVPESQEEVPATAPDINGKTETEYIEEQQDERHYDGRDFINQEKQKSKKK